ncbi:MAG: helix-hairpin-helix domain-containing protein [Desulfatiglandales bacterium]
MNIYLKIKERVQERIKQILFRKEIEMKSLPVTIATCILVISILLMPVSLLAADKVNLNTATQEELMTLEGVGANYAQKIMDYREAHGPFEKIEDITNVKGIGPKIFDANKTIMTVE